MLPPHRTTEWFRGPGHYFWTSETRLVDLELGYCATRQELDQAIVAMTGAGRELQEMGGSAYRTRAQVHALTPAWPLPILGLITPQRVLAADH
ncbi:MAG: hypothetical protein HQL91_10555 [Magnetococcales bacterium]|nr:hypothetical protein [Magnetococcales bacterium]